VVAVRQQSLFSLPDANVIVPGRNYTALVDLEREDAASVNAPAAKGAETATTGAASKEVVPQQAQGKPDAKTTGEMKADGKRKRLIRRPTRRTSKPGAA
jgi:hypothetical protein